MKKIAFFVVVGFVLAACSAKPYKMTAVDKETQRGFHHNEAQRILDTNEKNKDKNAKANEKSKEAQNEHLNALNKNKAKGAAANKDRSFKFY